ncbi:hypothetical protein AB0L57_31480 [Nocardia sp. NPDC052254]|uniref:hypothetical protein n=1 Tax=Nocardia sp. NPDC052254 TaxID=3155681 RepID=UPI00341E9933
MTTDHISDSTMTAIGTAVERGRAGDIDRARADLTDLWTGIGPTGDALHRCTLAHHLADLQPDPAQALIWDIRALDAADALTDARLRRHHDGLRIAGFQPSLRLNIADNLRRLGSFDAAADHLAAARQHIDALPDDAYGRGIRQAIEDSAEMVAARSTEHRDSAPGVTT